MLCFLIFLMFEVVMPYALWSCLYDDTLLDLLCLMLRCLTFPASWCLMSSSPRYSFWSCLRVFYAAWSSLYQAILLAFNKIGLLCIMLGYRILSLWCQAAWSYLLHAALLHPPYLMSNCLMSCTSDHEIWSVLHDARLLGLLYLLLRCWAFPPHVRLLDVP